nr:glycoside hydrolase family 43 protein [Opitutus terrae]
MPAPAQDPHVLFHDGLYHYCESTPAGIFLRSAANFVDLARAPRRWVWTPPARGLMAKNLWAPELHQLDGRFYIYFAADDGRNANHRMWVLSASDLGGPFLLVGQLETGGWAIDGTVFPLHGERYFVWSGWPGRRNGQQNLYLARMRSPLALEGPRVLLTTPDQPWERRGLPLCEGPQVLQHHGRTFLVYSASGSWTEDYCLGLLSLEGFDVLDPRSWRKRGPVFHKTAHAWGVGHCGFATTPDGNEHWLLYHAKTSRQPGWIDREVRAQRFTWSSVGEPVFGEPVARTLAQPRPAVDLAPRAEARPVVNFPPLARSA